MNKKIMALALLLSAPVALNAVQNVNSSQLQNIISGKKAAVFFYDSQCPHCIKFKRSGIFGSAEKSHPGITFAEINVRNDMSALGQFGASRVPSILFFKGGQEVDRVEGAPDAGELNAKLGQL